MAHLSDGTIIDSAFGLPNIGSAAHRQFRMLAPQIGQVISTHPIDDPQNHSKTQVEYDVMVMENRTGLIVHKGMRRLETFGNSNNFNEVILQDSPDGTATIFKDFLIGSWVVVIFISGYLNQGVIIGEIQHPAFHKKISTSPVPAFTGAGNSDIRDSDMQNLPTLLPGAKVADGERILGEYNGLRWNINKDGELTVMCQGAKDSRGNLTTQSAGSILKLNKNGEIILIDRLDQAIKVSPEDGTITLSDGNSNPTSIRIARKSGVVEIKTQGHIALSSARGKSIILGGDDEPLVLGQTFTTFLQTFLNSLNVAFQGLAAASNGPLAPLKPGFTACALACTVALSQLPTIVSKKAFTTLGP